MAKRQAIAITNIEAALKGDMQIVLLSPKLEESGLSHVFQEKSGDESVVSADNAQMSKLSDWAKPNKYSVKKYGHIETSDWPDFEYKLQRIIQAGKTPDLYIEYEGYITHSRNTLWNKEESADLLNSLQRGGRGISLYSKPDLSVSFLRFEFDNTRSLSVSLPYLEGTQSSLQQAYLYRGSQYRQNSEYSDRYDHVNL